MIKYKGHYEVAVTNVYGEKEKHNIRFVNKPSWFKRLFAKLAGFIWEDREVTMTPPVKRTPRKKSAATV